MTFGNNHSGMGAFSRDVPWWQSTDYGDGGDGDLNVTGTTSLTASNPTPLRYRKITISPAGILQPMSTVVICDTIEGSGTIKSIGAAGSAGSYGTGAVNGQYGSNSNWTGTYANARFGCGCNAGNGGQSGGAAGVGDYIRNSYGYMGGQNADGSAGTGGNGTSTNGGAGGTNGTGRVLSVYRYYPTIIQIWNPAISIGYTGSYGGQGGAGGGGGGAAADANGCGGGGGGAGGGPITIIARVFNFTGKIIAYGGDGGPGASDGGSGHGGGGGGCGGGGGIVVIVTDSPTISCAINVNGGAKGLGGTGGTGATNGGDGLDGLPGYAYLYNPRYKTTTRLA